MRDSLGRAASQILDRSPIGGLSSGGFSNNE